MAPTVSFNDLLQRYQLVVSNEHTKDNLIKDALLYIKALESLDTENQALKVKLHETELDLQAATRARRDLQKNLEDAESQYQWIVKQNEEIKNTNPYVLILIDGDGLIFNSDFIDLGLEGGKKAAHTLNAAVAKLCSHERTGSLEIVCRVVANVAGLSKAMYRNGSIDDPSLVREFALGFTQARASFDFIDVGYGKERADFKIRDTARWHLGNENCKHILLGIGHDAGYAPFLDTILENEQAHQCVSILKGGPLAREITEMNLNTIEFDDIFRTTRLISKVPSEKLNGQRTEVIKTQSLPTASVTTQAVLTPATSTASMSPPASSWAKITKSVTPPPQLTMPLPPKQQDKNTVRNKTPVQPAWSPGPRGLDPPITVTVQAMENIKRRAGNDKLCNNHFLRGPCTRMDICPFVHNYKLSQEDIRALAMLSRQNPCTSGQDCDVEDCIYGHHCPNVTNGVCTRQYCRFPKAAHPPNTKFTNKNINDN
ncbi:hypothetical protein BKA59DRAFT_527980 [Fusarium tricinctum]|uniref:C3H1-type domain-containing protein n=2 Tax=Fusarium tricinctum species complex TaxID=679429 RepID=A0A8K0WCJ8_9HYPO|nr:hypothetical protein BKA59DRAFT_527980 [Fusarium tricinctum]CEG03688.1 unnamed protein product [Fusarium acuminatum CS5907]